MEKKNLFSSVASQKAYERQADSLVNKYGYFLEPDLKTYRSCAYRFQGLKDKETPKKLSLAVSSYFVGKLRFCAAFYYLRSTKKELDTLRFYYGMALSSILGLSAYETLGAACCKNMSVSEENKAFKKLLHVIGHPSLSELAIEDAKIFINQTRDIHPDWFLPEGTRLQEKEIERERRGEVYTLLHFYTS